EELAAGAGGSGGLPGWRGRHDDIPEDRGDGRGGVASGPYKGWFDVHDLRPRPGRDITREVAFEAQNYDPVLAVFRLFNSQKPTNLTFAIQATDGKKELLRLAYRDAVVNSCYLGNDVWGGRAR